MKKIYTSVFLLLAISINILGFSDTSYAGVNLQILKMLDYNTEQPLAMAWIFNSKVDNVLGKFNEDYYRQFLFLKGLNDKLSWLSRTSSPKNKNLFDELENYMYLKAELVYLLSKMTDKTIASNINSEFKKNIEKKWTTMRAVIIDTNKYIETNKYWNMEITNLYDSIWRLTKDSFTSATK